MIDKTIAELVKGSTVYFDSYRAGNLYYNLVVPELPANGNPYEEENKIYQFTIPIEDTSGATFLNQDKALTFMRWIRKALETNTLIEL